MARGRRRPAGVLGRERQVRRRPAPRHRHRSRGCALDPSALCGRGVVRWIGADARPDRDDRDAGRLQSLVDPPRLAASPQGRDGRRRGFDRGSRLVRGGRARDPIRPSRGSRRGERDLRRSTELASVAECSQPSPGTRGAARTQSTDRAAGLAPGGRAASSRSGSRSYAGPGARACAGRTRAGACERGSDGSGGYRRGCSRAL
jgi:hypothetical protein